jgi:1-acyl-sn-glycerol-3-phosphate acyltransferase
MEGHEPKCLQEVNIRKVFHEKNPRIARLIPGFIYRYLEKIAHQDDVNLIIRKFGEKINLEFVEAAIKEFGVTLEVHGEENIPKEGRFIFVSNHPLGGFDGLLIMKIISRYYSSLKFMVNDILMNITNLHGIFIPINKHGKQAADSAKALDEAFSSDMQILTFPAGLVSRKIKGQIVDLEWHKNFISKAREYKRDVVPIFMSGRNTDFFYRLANFRKFIGIKANIEMLYLVDETFKHRKKHLVIKFGESIPWQTFDNSKKPKEWAKWVKEKVYRLNGIDSLPL